MEIVKDGTVLFTGDLTGDWETELANRGITGYEVRLNEAEAREVARAMIRNQIADVESLFASLSDIVCGLLPAVIESAKAQGGDVATRAVTLEQAMAGEMFPFHVKDWSEVCTKFTRYGRDVTAILQSTGSFP